MPPSEIQVATWQLWKLPRRDAPITNHVICFPAMCHGSIVPARRSGEFRHIRASEEFPFPPTANSFICLRRKRKLLCARLIHRWSVVVCDGCMSRSRRSNAYAEARFLMQADALSCRCASGCVAPSSCGTYWRPAMRSGRLGQLLNCRRCMQVRAAACVTACAMRAPVCQETSRASISSLPRCRHHYVISGSLRRNPMARQHATICWRPAATAQPILWTLAR